MRLRLAFIVLAAATAAVAAVVVLSRGPDTPRTLSPGAGNTETTEDPLAWEPDKRAELERRAAAAGQRRVRLITTEVLREARALYEAEGYAVVATPREGARQDYWMEKRLAS